MPDGKKEIVVLSAARTPFGKFCGALKDLTATELGVVAARAAMVRAGETIFALEDDGEMVVMKAARDKMNVVRRYDVADSQTWAQPAISGSRVYVKDVSNLTLWTLD